MIQQDKYSFIIVTLVIISCLACSRQSEWQVQSLSNPVQKNSELPYLHADDSNVLHMSWIHHTNDSGGVALYYSRLDDTGWSPPEMIQNSSSWFVNWADFPSVTGNKGKAVAAHWLDKIPGNTYSYNVNLSFVDGNGNWSEPVVPHRDGTATEHGFVSMVNWESDQILAAWLDGRQTADRAEDEYFDHSKAMSLRSAVIASDGRILQRHLIDDIVCDCCQTSMIKTPEGALAAYRDRSEQEIRDISVSRFTNGSWTEPQRVHPDNWEIRACPVNGPVLAADDSLTVVAWYTAADSKPLVKAAVSTDFGKSFSEPFLINEGETSGRVDAVVAESQIFISWLEKEGDRTAIKVKRIHNGELSNSYTVAFTDPSRRSGFPQMELIRDRLIIAWTDITGSEPVIRTKSMIFGDVRD